MRKFIYHVGLYSLIILIVFNIVGAFSLYSLRKSCFYKPEFVENGVKENKFDYIVLGSSVGLTTLDTRQIDEQTKMKGLNISIDDTGMSTHYLMLNHFYAIGKTTKRLVLAVTPWDSENVINKKSDNDYYFLPYIQRDYVYDYFKNDDHEINIHTISKYLPFIGVSFYNVEVFYPSILSFFMPHKRNRFDAWGNYTYPLNGVGLENRKNENLTVHFRNPYFKKIKDFCKQNKIELIVYQSPIYKKKVDYVNGLEVINHSVLIKDKKCFYDQIHVNSRGREICSKAFANNLILLDE